MHQLLFRVFQAIFRMSDWKVFLKIIKTDWEASVIKTSAVNKKNLNYFAESGHTPDLYKVLQNTENLCRVRKSNPALTNLDNLAQMMKN